MEDDKLLLIGDAAEDEDDRTYSRSGGCFGHTTGLKEWFGRRGWGWHWFRARVLLALLGNLLFWVGAWNIWQYDCGLDPTAPGCSFNATSGRDVIEHVGTGVHNPAFRAGWTSALGLALLVASDTLLMNAGLEGALFPSWHTAAIKTTQRGKGIMAARTVVAALGTTACWSGAYAMMQNTALGQDWSFCEHDRAEFTGAASKTNASIQCADDFIIHFLVFGVGLILLGLTGTYSSLTFLYPDEESDLGAANGLQRYFGFEWVDPEEYTTSVRVWYSVRAVISILAQTLIWISSTRALDYSKPTTGDRLERPLFYTCLGLLLMVGTDALVGNSYFEEEEEEEEEEDEDDTEDGEAGDTPATQAPLALYEDGSEEIVDFDPKPKRPARPGGMLEPRASSLGEPNDVTVNSAGMFNEFRSMAARDRTGSVTAYRTRTNTGAVIVPVDIDSAEPEPGCHADRSEFARWHLRSFVALLGQLIYFYGAWTVVDTFAAGTATAGAMPGSVLTYYMTEWNIFLMLLGITILALIGGVMTAASLGVMPVYVPEGDDEDNLHSVLPIAAVPNSRVGRISISS